MIELKTNIALRVLAGVVAAMLFHIGTASLSNRSKVTVQAPSAVPMLTARPATPTERTQGTATDDVALQQPSMAPPHSKQKLSEASPKRSLPTGRPATTPPAAQGLKMQAGASKAMSSARSLPSPSGTATPSPTTAAPRCANITSCVVFSAGWARQCSPTSCLEGRRSAIPCGP